MKPFENWIAKAEGDLRAAKDLLSISETHAENVFFHAHQCAEKSLKAFRAFRRQENIKTHDLDNLLIRCIEMDGTFDALVPFIEILGQTPLETIRYPESDMPPVTGEEARGAVQAAEAVFDHVKLKLA